MFNVIKKLSIAFVIFVCLTSTGNAMKLMDDKWEEFDLKPFGEKIEAKNIAISPNGNFFSETEPPDKNCKLKTKLTKVRIWNINNVTPIITFNKVRFFSDISYFSPKENFLIIPQPKFWGIYSFPSSKLIESFSTQPRFSPDEKNLGAWKCAENDDIENFNLNNDYEIFSIELQSCKKIKTIKNVLAIDFSNATSDQDRKVGFLYDNNKNNKLDIFKIKEDGSLEKENSIEMVSKFHFIQNTNFLNVADYCQYEDMLTNQEEKTLDMSTWKEVAFGDVKFSPDGILWAKVNEKNQLKVFNMKSLDEIKSFENVQYNKFSFSANGTFLAFLLKDNILNIWNTKTKKLSVIIENYESFYFSRCENFIFVKFKKSEVKIFKYVPLK